LNIDLLILTLHYLEKFIIKSISYVLIYLLIEETLEKL